MIDNYLSQFANTADGVLAIDSKSRIILWNSSAEQILGFSKEEILGKSCHEIIKGDDHHGNRYCFNGCPVFQLAKQRRQIRNFNLHVLMKRGRKVWLNLSTILVNKAGKNDWIIVHLFRPLERGGPDLTPPSGKLSSLTNREKEIFLLMSRGMATKEIAIKLGISATTVRTLLQRVYKKLDVHNRLEAINVTFLKDFQ